MLGSVLFAGVIKDKQDVVPVHTDLTSHGSRGHEITTACVSTTCGSQLAGIGRGHIRAESEKTNWSSLTKEDIPGRENRMCKEQDPWHLREYGM